MKISIASEFKKRRELCGYSNFQDEECRLGFDYDSCTKCIYVFEDNKAIQIKVKPKQFSPCLSNVFNKENLNMTERYYKRAEKRGFTILRNNEKVTLLKKVEYPKVRYLKGIW